ncbi:hypothetical protein VSDG_07653 [Cytospora chrysosperma]|uniref:Uncharacterized protein n=1 Tax=Cytospora chrysosperma TaxID=252740 RepID=A0A423VLU1_CYTCH|nr:hypothetical protein VSDG_07653 [Valsa sordida]
MRRPSIDLSEPSRSHDESMGTAMPDSSDADAVVSSQLSTGVGGPLLPLEEDFIYALDLQADGEPHRVYTPPPHLAARFYRPSQTRRKGSAASTRRNSISSLHSLPSSLAAGALSSGPQSKHVANRQRRDAILKDRQNRLAARAAHVEKVRLRAARTKEQAMAISVERAEAARLARERNLKDIAATCAEEVKRAKAIAEATREKREQETLKMRQQIQERQAEAERRREELRRQNTRSRGSSLGTRKSVEILPLGKEAKESEMKPLTEAAAVWRIQNWWRVMARRRAVYEFSQLRLNVDGAREKQYDEFTAKLGEQGVLMTTARVLAMCGLQQGDLDSVEQMKTVRCFLSAFLILGHPAQVLSNTYDIMPPDQGSPAHPIPRDDLTDPQCQELVARSRDLLITFETLMSRLTSLNNYTVPPALANDLPRVYSQFETAFFTWKARDKNALVDGMLGQLVELDATLDYVRETSDRAVVEQYQESMKLNQLMLIQRISKLIGRERGLASIKEARLRAKKARAANKKKQKADLKPRIADQSMTTDSVMADLGTKSQSSSSQSSSASAVYPTPPSTPASRPQGPKPRKKGMLLPDNRTVVHELAINKQYRVQADDFVEAETKALEPLLDEMRATMHLVDARSREVHFYLLLKIAKHVRDKLQRLVKPGNSVHTFIGELLDAKELDQRFRNGSFSYERFFASMGALLPKLCAPVRDDQVQDLVENKLSQGSYVERLEALILFIDVMLSDYANHLLQIVAPQLLESAPEYEAKAFASAIEHREHGLFAAEVAWRAARSKVIADTSRRDPENINHPKNRPTAERIYVHMLVDIFTQPSTMRYGQIPEMLQLDYKRIRKYGHLTRNIITTGGILLQCKNLLKRDVRAPWKTEAARIMNVLDHAVSQESAVAGIMAALEAGRSMPSTLKNHLRGLVDKLVAVHREMVTTQQPDPSESWDPNAHDPSQPVLRLLLKRLRDHVLGRMAAGSNSEKAKVTNTAGERLATSGLAEFVDRVKDMIDEMTKVGAVDREAHGPWWDTVAEKVEAQSATATAAARAVVPAT